MNNLSTSLACAMREKGIRCILSYDKIYKCDSCGFIFLCSEANIKIDKWMGEILACPECGAWEGWFLLAPLPIINPETLNTQQEKYHD